MWKFFRKNKTLTSLSGNCCPNKSYSGGTMPAATVVKSVVCLRKQVELKQTSPYPHTDITLSKITTFEIYTNDIFSNGNQNIRNNSYIKTDSETDAEIVFDYLLENNGVLSSKAVIKETELLKTK